MSQELVALRSALRKKLKDKLLKERRLLPRSEIKSGHREQGREKVWSTLWCNYGKRRGVVCVYMNVQQLEDKCNAVAVEGRGESSVRPTITWSVEIAENSERRHGLSWPWIILS